MSAKADGSGLRFSFQADGPSRFNLYYAGKVNKIFITSGGRPLDIKPIAKGIWSFDVSPGKITARAG